MHILPKLKKKQKIKTKTKQPNKNLFQNDSWLVFLNVRSVSTKPIYQLPCLSSCRAMACPVEFHSV